MRIVFTSVVAILLVAAGCGSDEEEARTTTGREATRSIDAVIGDYAREITEKDIERTAARRRKGEQTPSPGKARLVIRERVMQVFVPEGFSISQELTVTDDEWHIGPYLGSGMDAFCAEGDRPATYTWKLEGDELTLSPKDEACPDRDSTLTGTWTKGG